MNIQSQVPQAGSVRIAAATLAAAGAILLAACSSGTSGSGSATPAPPTTQSGSPATTATASAATCKHVASIRSSLDSLTHVQLNASSAKQIKTDLTNIKTQLVTLKTENTGTLSVQLGLLSDSVKQVQKAAQGVSAASPSAAQFQAIITALTGLKATSQTAVSKMAAVCPHS